MKQLLPCVLVVLSSSVSVYAQMGAPSNPETLAVDTKNLKKSIQINVIFPGRTELYRGSETGPTQLIAGVGLPRKTRVSIPFLDINNLDIDITQSNSSAAPDALEEAVKSAFASVQQSILMTEDASSLYPSMVPQYDEKDKDKIVGYSFNRAELEMLESSEKNTVRVALQSKFAAYEDFFNNLLKPKGYQLDLEQIGIADSRKIDETKIETPGELGSIAGAIFKGEKIENSDDYQWRLNLNQYTLRIEIRLKKI